jgi:glycogen synthase
MVSDFSPPAAGFYARDPLPRRVLMTTDTVGGVWTYAMELCRGLHDAGVEVILATMGGAVSAAQCAEVAAVPGLQLEEKVCKLEWMTDAADDVAQAGDWLLGVAERHHPDVIHLNGYAHAALPWAAPVLVVAHSCVVTWWRAVHAEDPPSSYEHYTRAVRAGLSSAHRLAAPSRAFLEDFRLAHGPLPPTHVVPNGRDPRRFAPAEKEPFFLSVGRLWDHGKNVAALASISPRLRWPVRVAGDATSPEGQTLDLPNLELLGRCVPEIVSELMARAAVYVLPARYEPFGFSVLEAGLSGCALVLGDLPSLRENWEGAAVFVRPDAPDELEHALNRLAEEPQDREKLAARARERAQEFTAAAMVERYLEIYRTLLASAAPSAIASA